jgi:hypothetical protein
MKILADLELVRCLSESSIDCEINLWKMELNVDKGVI